MSTITCKTVKRYYLNGRGYANSVTAYRIAAKSILNSEVFRLFPKRDSKFSGWSVENADAIRQDERERVTESFVKAFPHEPLCGCRLTRRFCKVAYSEKLKQIADELRRLDELEGQP